MSIKPNRTLIDHECCHCKKPFKIYRGRVNRAILIAAPLYCGRVCAGIARRKSKAEKIELKRLYDLKYREKNFDLLKIKKHEAFKKSYNPEKAAIERKKRMPIHVDYCRRPEYRAKKKEYDKNHRASVYGDFSEAYLLFVELSKEILVRMPRIEISKANGTLNKKYNRRFKNEIVNRL